jgi:hypothetical protein
MSFSIFFLGVEGKKETRHYIMCLPFPICETRLVGARISLALAPAQFRSLVSPRLLALILTSY